MMNRHSNQQIHPFSSLSAQPAGFALIATISVMVLLVMIALAMLNLATIEQRTSAGDSAYAEAQMNARMALMEAIAKLQTSAGQDQRITASANFAGNSDGTFLAAGAAPRTTQPTTAQTKASAQCRTAPVTGPESGKTEPPTQLSIFSPPRHPRSMSIG